MSERSAEKDLVRRLFAAFVRAASPDDPTGHLPNCGYAEERMECGCADFGKRLHAAITACVMPPATEDGTP